MSEFYKANRTRNIYNPNSTEPLKYQFFERRTHYVSDKNYNDYPSHKGILTS